MVKNKLRIFSVFQDVVYESSLTEVVNQCKVGVPEDKLNRFYFISSEIQESKDIPNDATSGSYIYVNANGDLFFCRTLEGFIHTIEQRVQEGCKFYEVEEILEDYVDLMIETLGKQSVQDFIKKVPNERCALVLKDNSTKKLLSVKSFNRSNFLCTLGNLADSQTIYESYKKDLSKVSSTLSMTRFMRLISNIKYATIFDKAFKMRSTLFDHKEITNNEYVNNLSSLSNTEFMIRDIVTFQCEQFELPFHSLTEINNLADDLNVILNYIEKDLLQTVSFESGQTNLNASISTDPLA